MSLRQPVVSRKSSKQQYTEHEVAEVLSISVEQLRDVVRRHILTGSDDGPAPLIPVFHASDLVLLRVLTTMQGGISRSDLDGEDAKSARA